ncbi:Spo0J and IME4 domain-containing protein [Dokdonella sp.]|uniref:Spo0J and IME4 domain-containing protein n=1 Tax=Dokdonella sp. TaxID=2291710 RepID=UPI0037847FF6
MHSSKRLRLATPDQVAALDAVLAHVQEADGPSDENLAASLRQNGQLVPILRRGGQLVDGRRRMRALTALGREPWILDLPVDDSDAASPLLLGRSFFEINACRRELTLGVRAAMADVLATWTKGVNQHTRGDAGMSREEAARAAGISADTLDRYRRVKGAPDVHAKVLKGEWSLPQAVRVVESRTLAAKAKRAVSQEGDIAASLDQLCTQHTALNLFLADPAWDYGNKRLSTHSAAPERHYPTMDLDAIKKLPVSRLAAKDAVLFLWTPNCLLKDALEVLEAWGFRYVTAAVWIKRRGVPTLGAILPKHETLLMGKRGQGLVSAGKPMASVFIDPDCVEAHSRKPPHFVDEIERLYPDAAKVELFSREARKGWLALGNQVAMPPSGPKRAAANDGTYAAAKKTQVGRNEASGQPRSRKVSARAKRKTPRAKPTAKPKGTKR